MIDYTSREISEQEYKVVQILRTLKPYGKMEIALNQNGTMLSITVNNPVRVEIQAEVRRID